MERLPAPRLASRSTLAPAALVVVALGGCAGGEGATATTTTTTTTTGGESESESESGSTTAMVDPPTPKTWEVMLDADKELGSIFSVWADGPSTVMAVGGQPLAGVVLTLEGDAWVRDETLPPATPRLSWLHGIGEFRVAVGYLGAIATRIDGVWSLEMSPVDAPLWGVWGETPDELWVVGGATAEGKPVLLRYDGGAWAEVDVSALVRGSNALYKIWGRSADDIYAVGAQGVILHWDGVAWAREEVSTVATLIGVDGDDDEVIIAGGRASGIVLRKKEGGEWSAVVFPEDEGFDGELIEADGRATVVGRRGFIAAFSPESLVYTLEESGVDHELHSVFAVPGGPVLVVGGHFDVAPYDGVILRRVE